MTPQQFRDAIAKLGLSQERAGVWLGLSVGYARLHQPRASFQSCSRNPQEPPPPLAASPRVSIVVEGHEAGDLLRRNIVEARSIARRKCGDDSDDCQGSIDGAHHARPLLDHRLLRVRQIKTLEIDGTRHRISPVLRGLR
jgi:hypothetical protein